MAKIIIAEDYKRTNSYCERKYTYTVLKLRVKQKYVSQRYNSTQKILKSQLEIIKSTSFARKFSRGHRVLEKALLGSHLCLWEYTQKVSPTLVSGTIGRTHLEHSSHMVKVDVEAICKHFKPWRILKETNEPRGPFKTMSQEPWRPGKGVNWIALSNPTAGKSAQMQVIKQTEHERIWDNKNDYLFRRAMINLRTGVSQ